MSKRSHTVERYAGGPVVLPAPVTASVLFIAVAAVVPQLGLALHDTLSAVPIYIAFGVIALVICWVVANAIGPVEPPSRAIALSAGTHNSHLVLPLALALPGAVLLLLAIIVTLTVVELVSELAYVRTIPRLGRLP